MPAQVDRYQRLIESQENWDLDHPVMRKNNEDLLSLWSLLQAEVDETGDEVLDYMILQQSGAVPHEMVDRLAKELDDVFMFTLQMYTIIGVDLYDSVMDKRAYNMTRFTSAMYSNGRTYDEARTVSKQWVKDTGWKDEFYHPVTAGEPTPVLNH
jgi:NTP pyrophosphatase (non-canonical NTP hydrolase)